MANIEKFNLSNGEVVDAEPIDITQSSEYWNQYLLGDGSVIKMKLVATKVLRLVNRYDAAGAPVYYVNSTNILSLNAPESLKKK